MEQGYCKDGYDESDFVLSNRNMIFIDEDSALGNVQHQGMQLLNERMKTMCKSAALQKLRSSFGAMYSDRVHGRLIDMISQCRYIASKQGMDKRQLIASIRQDEMAGRDYITSFCNTPSRINGGRCYCFKELPKISFTTNTTSNMTPGIRAFSPCVHNSSCVGEDQEIRCWETICRKVKAGRDGNPLYHNSNSGISHLPHLKMESLNGVEGGGRGESEDDANLMPMADQSQHQHQPCIFISRPSTRHGLPLEEQPLPNCDDSGFGESLMDGIGKLGMYEEDSESSESDFDPSQTSDLFQGINSAKTNSCINGKEHFMNHQTNGMEVGKRVKISRCSASNTSLCNDVILPNRKPATHNLAALYKNEKEIMDEDLAEKMKGKLAEPVVKASIATEQQQELIESFGKDETEFSSSEDDDVDDDEEEAKQLMITTARSKACASYIQLRQKMTKGCASSTTAVLKPPLFGTFDEFDQHLVESDFVTLDEKSAEE